MLSEDVKIKLIAKARDIDQKLENVFGDVGRAFMDVHKDNPFDLTGDAFNLRNKIRQCFELRLERHKIQTAIDEVSKL